MLIGGAYHHNSSNCSYDGRRGNNDSSSAIKVGWRAVCCSLAFPATHTFRYQQDVFDTWFPSCTCFDANSFELPHCPDGMMVAAFQ